MGRTEEGLTASLAGAQPWPETGRAEHITAAALFLAGDDARFVTGEALVVDGGMTAVGPDFTGRLTEESPLAGLVGVSRGTTGQEPTIHQRSESARRSRWPAAMAPQAGPRVGMAPPVGPVV
jgi:hypothetical protein